MTSAMSTIMQLLEATFQPIVMIFAVANLFAMGLQTRLPALMAALKNTLGMALIFVWGWVLGPVIGYVITRVIPLAEPYVIVILLSSLAPCSPFFPTMVERARGDVGFAAAFFPVVVVGALVSLPLIGPLVIEGLSVSSWDLASPLFLTLLLPMAVGLAVRHYAEVVACRAMPAVNITAKIITLIMLAECMLIYVRQMLETAGSFALLSATVFSVLMALISYQFGFGLHQNQRSVMAMGMLTRNLPAIAIVVLIIPNLDPRVITFTVMWGVWSAVLGAIAARVFAKQAGEADAGSSV